MVTEDTYRQFPTGHKFFYQQFASVLCGFTDGGVDFVLTLHDHDAHGRSLAWCLDDDGQWKRWALPGMNHFPRRSRDSIILKFFFCSNFVESGLASFYSLARIGDPAALQNSLDLPVFAEGSVNGQEREIDIAR